MEDLCHLFEKNLSIYNVNYVIKMQALWRGHSVRKRLKISNISSNMTEINLENINKIPSNYPFDFVLFCHKNNLKPPKINSGNGQALVIMLYNPYCYFTRKSCDEFVKKFNIQTKDSIQLFNKHEQWGIKTSRERGKNYILFPYQLSNKHKMRFNFNYNGTEEEKNKEIDNIKSSIMEDYINVPNKDWQLGHKNPNSIDNSYKNLVLQPPIQAKYRDNYIFLDTLTKVPTVTKLIDMIESGNSPYTNDELERLKNYFSR